MLKSTYYRIVVYTYLLLRLKSIKKNLYQKPEIWVFMIRRLESKISFILFSFPQARKKVKIFHVVVYVVCTIEVVIF